MDGVMAVLDEMDGSREQVLLAIEALPDEALLAVGAVGRYSAAAVLALQAAWEAELVTGLMRLDQGRKPEKLLAALAKPLEYEIRRIAEYQGRDLDRIFEDWQQVRMQLESWLEMFSERDLMNRKRFKWLDGKSLRQVIEMASSEREKGYVAELAAFAQGWLAAHPSEESGVVIPLTAVSPPSPVLSEVEDENEKSD